MTWKQVAVIAVIVVVVAAAAVAIAWGGDDTDSVDTDGMYRGYDAYYDFTVSGATSDTYASELVSVVSDADVLFVQSALEGYPLRTIGEGAFSDCTSGTIVVPDTVTSVHEGFLDGCPADTVIFLGEVPDGVGEDERVTTLDLNGGDAETATVTSGGAQLTLLVWDGSAAVIGVTGDGDVSVPDSVEASDGSDVPVVSVGCGAFGGSEVASVTLPSTLERIQTRAFYGCGTLTSVALPSGLLSVEDEAFRNCTGLGDTDLGDVLFIGFEAFRNCSSMTAIDVPDSVGFLGDGAFYMCSGAVTASVGSGTTALPDRTFGYCSSLESVTFRGTVTSLGSYAFVMCRALTSVDTSDVEVVGSNAFNECRALGEVDLGSVVDIGSNAFYNCRSLTSVELPETLESLGSTVFLDCRSLTDVWFHGDMPEMEDDSLSGVTEDCTIHVSGDHADSWSGYDGEISLFRSDELQRGLSRRHPGGAQGVPSADHEDVARPHQGGPADLVGDRRVVHVHVPVREHYDAAPVIQDPCGAAFPSGPDAGVALIDAVEHPIGGIDYDDALLEPAEDVRRQADVDGPDPQGGLERLPGDSDRDAGLPDRHQPLPLQCLQEGPHAALADVEEDGEPVPAHAPVVRQELQGEQDVGVREPAGGARVALVQDQDHCLGMMSTRFNRCSSWMRRAGFFDMERIE